MAEASVYVFTFKELAETLVKKQDVHEGHWSIYVKFGLGAANVGGFGGAPLLPTAFIPVVELGIQKSDKPSDLTVDASQINPAKKTRAKKRLNPR